MVGALLSGGICFSLPLPVRVLSLSDKETRGMNNLVTNVTLVRKTIKDGTATAAGLDGRLVPGPGGRRLPGRSGPWALVRGAGGRCVSFAPVGGEANQVLLQGHSGAALLEFSFTVPEQAILGLQVQAGTGQGLLWRQCGAFFTEGAGAGDPWLPCGSILSCGTWGRAQSGLRLGRGQAGPTARRATLQCPATLLGLLASRPCRSPFVVHARAPGLRKGLLHTLSRHEEHFSSQSVGLAHACCF